MTKWIKVPKRKLSSGEILHSKEMAERYNIKKAAALAKNPNFPMKPKKAL